MDVIGALTNPSTQVSAGPNGFSELGSEDFIKIIFTELSKQDPLKPSDTNALLEQLSTLRSIQSDMDLSDKLTSLVGQNEFANAAGLIGKHVSGLTLGNTMVEDEVVSVARSDIGPILTLKGGERLPIDRVIEILPTPEEE